MLAPSRLPIQYIIIFHCECGNPTRSHRPSRRPSLQGGLRQDQRPYQVPRPTTRLASRQTRPRSSEGRSRPSPRASMLQGPGSSHAHPGKDKDRAKVQKRLKCWWITQSAGIESSGSSISAGGFTGGVNESKSVPWFTFTYFSQNGWQFNLERVINRNVLVDLTDQCVVDGHFKGIVWSHNKPQQVRLRTLYSTSDTMRIIFKPGRF